MKARQTALSLALMTLISALATSACQQRAVIDTGGFGGGVMRLGDTEVARVDGTPIYLSDVERAAAAQGLIAAGTALSLDDPLFRTTLDGLIDQRLLALDALRRGVDQEDEARRRLLAARERILGNYNVERRLNAAVSEERLRELFDAQAALAALGPERRIRQIVVADEASAQAVLQRLEDEEDFAELAQALSQDADSRDRGGRLGWVSRDMLPGPMRGPVFETAIGARAPVFSSALGWHVVEVLDERRPEKREFEDVREELARFLTYQTIEQLTRDLRDTADISLGFGAAAAGQAGASEPPTPADETP